MRRSLRPFVVLALSVPLALAQAPADRAGVLPVGADGKPLNLDFEKGNLDDWTAEGEAFKDQPVEGDAVHARRADMKSEHQGQFWIGGYEKLGDKAQGTLTSASFKVTHPWASFLVGGGPHNSTSVELVRKDTGTPFFRASGNEEENLKRVVVDLKKHKDQEIFIRVVDRHTGHWGHVNFDDFRFHATKPDFPARQAPAVLDAYKFAGLTADKAAEAMTAPEGFSVKPFAGEPDVQQPIALCLDDRGRVWVAEAYSYPVRRPDKEAKDRILIFEDTDGDGKFDKRTVFMEGLNLVSGLEVGFGGVWIGAAPYLMFVPIKDGEDKPAGEPKILLDGWAYQDTHETLNTFIWGPDGWLYGCHGVFTHSRVGKPGTDDKDRIPINAGIWRYHPTKHVFEVFVHGTSNPWGLDFDDWGQAFCEACVIPHNWHIIQGARYHRQAGTHFNPYTYDDIKTIAEHRHYLGATPHGGNLRSDSAGGGHAHCGTMVYLGGTWPDEYRNQMFMANVHGHRLNVDKLTKKGSGYVATRAPDFLMANDSWSRFINLRYGPDGNVFLIDWYDKQACHHNDPKIWDRTNGRIYKVVHKDARPVVGVDLGKKSDKELVELQLHANDWHVRHARRRLQERAHLAAQTKGADAITPPIHAALDKIAFEHKDETRRLRGLWALHVTNGMTAERVAVALADASPIVRAWTVQLALENGKVSAELLTKLAEMAKDDPSPVVRLYLASGLQRMAPKDRWEIARNLLTHAEDATDHNLPLLYWYAIEPLGAIDMERGVKLALHGKQPSLLGFMVRRVGTNGEFENFSLLVEILSKIEPPRTQVAFLNGMLESLRGRRQIKMPLDWPAVFAKLMKSGDAEVRNKAVSLAVTFGDASAFDEMRKVLTSKTADAAQRQNALDALLGAGDKQLAPVLQELVSDTALRGAALRGLASYDDAKTPQVLLGAYSTFNSAEKRDALNTLASRASYAKEMLGAIAAKKLAASEVSADVVRQLRNLKDAALDKQLGEVWGTVRATPADRLKIIANYKSMLSKASEVKPDLALGRALYAKTCSQCHTLFGTGGKVGPDVTGSNRTNLDYVLENILDPSSVIPKEYEATLFELKSGRVVTGLVRGETPAAFTVLTANETLTIPKNEIDAKKTSDASMMPDDLVKTLSERELRSLVAYLQSPTQVPLLATAENAADFFNGKDLTGWDGEPTLWKVENGEIVGKSPGIKKNEFLKSHMIVEDFRLSLKVKLTPNKENSGIQFRSEVLPGGDVKGYQADAGAGWWGKLYEEHGRALLWDKSGEQHVKVEDWNEYVIEAKGSKVRTWINGKPCVDLDDPKGARRGIIAFQIHSGGAMEVRFKDLKLEVLKPEK